MSRTQHTNFSADERSPWLTTRFKPLVTSLIAVDVLLVVVAIVVAVNVFGQGNPATVSYRAALTKRPERPGGTNK